MKTMLKIMKRLARDSGRYGGKRRDKERSGEIKIEREIFRSAREQCTGLTIQFMNCESGIGSSISSQGVSQKIKTADVFSKLGNQTNVYKKSPPCLATRKHFLVQPIERWKTSSWEKNISEHDTHKSPLRNVYHELGSDMEQKLIDRLILVK